MFCSTVIPTVGRPTLSRAVNSVLDQAFPADDFEIIVVNDSGQPLPQADWQRSERVQIINTIQRERSVARNTGAAIARGRYLHFLDDDDWLFPDALQHLWALSEHSDAVWLYGSSQLVDREGQPIIQLHHGLSGNCFLQVMAGEWIPLQASLIEARTFFELGGFYPNISGPEDIDLLRRVALHGDIAETQQLVAYIVRGEAGSTTNYDRHPQTSRWARERICDSPGAFARMRASASSSYWRGRILRLYLTSAVWNLGCNRLLLATSRTAFGLAALALARHHLLSADFWRAVAKPYRSITFARGFQEANPSAASAQGDKATGTREPVY
jgi:glycosyltransferase involved in cell wall biosynthesis